MDAFSVTKTQVLDHVFIKLSFDNDKLVRSTVVPSSQYGELASSTADDLTDFVTAVKENRAMSIPFEKSFILSRLAYIPKNECTSGQARIEFITSDNSTVEIKMYNSDKMIQSFMDFIALLQTDEKDNN